MDYTIVCHGSRSWSENYSTIEELRQALNYYGIPVIAAHFFHFDEYGMSKNTWKHYDIIAYQY